MEISHQLCESQYPEKVNDLYVQSIYMDEIRQCVETLQEEPKLKFIGKYEKWSETIRLVNKTINIYKLARFQYGLDRAQTTNK